MCADPECMCYDEPREGLESLVEQWREKADQDRETAKVGGYIAAASHAAAEAYEECAAELERKLLG